MEMSLLPRARTWRVWRRGSLVTFALAAAAACSRAGGAGRVVAELATRVDLAGVVRETRAVDFSSAADRRLLGAGWGPAEGSAESGPRFAWAVAREADLGLDLLRTDYGTLELRAWAFAYPGSPPQTVAVELNGTAVGSVTVTARPQTWVLKLPPGVVVVGHNRVVLRFAYAESPSIRKPPSGDGRTLAAAFECLRLGRGGPPPAIRAEIAPSAVPDGVYVPVGSAVVFRVGVPRASFLDLGLGMAEAADPNGLTAEVWVRRPGQAPARLDSREPPRRGGRRFQVDLAACAGQIVELWLLAVEDGTPPTARRAVVWEQPRLLTHDSRYDPSSSVLLVVVDTLRADHVGCYGARGATPAFDGLAKAGVRFSHAYSHIPITGPSHASLFTSRLPFQVGVHNNAQVLRDEQETLAEHLAAWHRRTAAVVSLGVLRAGFGLGRGFQHFDDSFGDRWWRPAGEVTDLALGWLAQHGNEPFFLLVHYSDPHEPYTPPGVDYPKVAVTANGERLGVVGATGSDESVPLELQPGSTVIRFQAEGRPPGTPLDFANIRVVGACREPVKLLSGWEKVPRSFHGPAVFTTLPATISARNSTGKPCAAHLWFACRERLSREESRERYAGEVAYVDRELSRLLAGMRERGQLTSTLVVFTSDHGEGLGDHGLTGHVELLYDALLKVPLILSYPGRIPQGAVVDASAGLVDVFPTVLDLLGLPPVAGLEGRSLLPLIGRPPGSSPPLVAETYRPEAGRDRRSVIEGGLKYIVTEREEGAREELYDLTADPGELSNLAASRPHDVERLRHLLAETLKRQEPGKNRGPQAVELSEEEEAQMRALGYLREP